MDHLRSAKRSRTIRAVCEGLEPRSYLSVTFASPAPTLLTDIQGPIIAGQFDSNSNFADLAVGTSNSVKILLGNKFGTFNVSSTIAFPVNPASETPFLVGNFSGNGSDLVLLSHDNSTHNGEITYEASQGNGTFIATGITPITNNGHGFTPIAGAVADFNLDSEEDLAILGKPTTGSSLVLAIMTSNNDGTFAETEDYAVTGSNTAGNLNNNTVLTASLNDGPPDIILYDGSGGNLDVFMGAGDGTFTQLTPLPLTATQIITDTFTSSGFPDVVAADGTQLTTLLGNGDGTFTAMPAETFDGTIDSLASADMDLDGNSDIITNLGVSVGGGDGTFANPVALPITEGGTTFAADIIPVDLDSDGREDLVGISSAGNALLSVQNITPTSSFVTVTSNETPASPGDDVQFTATVSSGLNLEPSGQVDFFDGSTNLGSAQVKSDGTATFHAGTALTPGSHSITADYEGDSDFFPSTSTAYTQSVLFPTTTVLTSNQNPSGAGEAVTFTANVSGNDGNGDVPSGNVEFFDGTTDLGGGTLGGNGNATFDDTSLANGPHQITAEYQADSNYAASTSAVLAQVVALPPLSPAVKSSTFGPSIVAGVAARGVAVVQLTNTTQSTISGATTVSVYASKDSTIGDGTAIASLPARMMVIAPSQTVMVRVPILLSQTLLAQGTYTLLAQVKYNSGTTSAATTGPTLGVATAFISLSEIVAAIKLPPTVVSGTSINGAIKLLITNSGNIASKGATAFSISFSTQSGQPGTTIPVVAKNLAIRARGSQVVMVPIASIPSLTPESYFPFVQVTDPSNDSSAVSSTAAIPIVAPVLTLSASLGPVRNAIGGDTVIITDTGNIPDSTSITSTIGFSTDRAGAQPIGGTTVVLGTPLVIKPGGSVRIHLNQWTSLVSALTDGSSYYLTAMITDDTSNTAFAVSSTSFIDQPVKEPGGTTIPPPPKFL